MVNPFAPKNKRGGARPPFGHEKRARDYPGPLVFRQAVGILI